MNGYKGQVSWDRSVSDLQRWDVGVVGLSFSRPNNTSFNDPGFCDRFWRASLGDDGSNSPVFMAGRRCNMMCFLQVCDVNFWLHICMEPLPCVRNHVMCCVKDNKEQLHGIAVNITW